VLSSHKNELSTDPNIYEKIFWLFCPIVVCTIIGTIIGSFLPIPFAGTGLGALVGASMGGALHLWESIYLSHVKGFQLSPFGIISSIVATLFSGLFAVAGFLLGAVIFPGIGTVLGSLVGLGFGLALGIVVAVVNLCKLSDSPVLNESSAVNPVYSILEPDLSPKLITSPQQTYNNTSFYSSSDMESSSVDINTSNSGARSNFGSNFIFTVAQKQSALLSDPSQEEDCDHVLIK
jgi:uncharacterized protein (DUF697 family)